eukprot:7379760-Prymnesium_polylepis.7
MNWRTSATETTLSHSCTTPLLLITTFDSMVRVISDIRCSTHRHTRCRGSRSQRPLRSFKKTL